MERNVICTSFSDGRAVGSLSSHRSITAMTPQRPPWCVPSPAVVQRHAYLASRKPSCTTAVIHDSRRPLNTRTLCARPAWYRHTHARDKYILSYAVASATRKQLQHSNKAFPLAFHKHRYNRNAIACRDTSTLTLHSISNHRHTLPHTGKYTTSQLRRVTRCHMRDTLQQYTTTRGRNGEVNVHTKRLETTTDLVQGNKFEESPTHDACTSQPVTPSPSNTTHTIYTLQIQDSPNSGVDNTETRCLLHGAPPPRDSCHGQTAYRHNRYESSATIQHTRSTYILSYAVASATAAAKLANTATGHPTAVAGGGNCRNNHKPLQQSNAVVAAAPFPHTTLQ